MVQNRTVALSLTVSLTGVAALVGCSIVVNRDLSKVPVGQVGFDDMCGLQEYFDALEIHTSPPPRIVSSLDLEGASSGGKVERGGRERFAFENDFQLKHLRRVLNENWRRLPDQLATASSIEIEVKWSEKAGAKRVVTDQEPEISVGPGAESWSLPYHVCLSELLYGEPLYRQRRVLWGLPLPGQPTPKPSMPGSGPVAPAESTRVDGGAGSADGGAARPPEPALAPRG